MVSVGVLPLTSISYASEKVTKREGIALDSATASDPGGVWHSIHTATGASQADFRGGFEIIHSRAEGHQGVGLTAGRFACLSCVFNAAISRSLIVVHCAINFANTARRSVMAARACVVGATSAPCINRISWPRDPLTL